jgi:AraC-like DNA-binding protein
MSLRIAETPAELRPVFAHYAPRGPKLYSRIERLQAVLRRIELLDEVDWAEVATSCGYFDQSHFIHDFREFTGLRPSDYLELRIAGQRNHVRVPD